MNEVVRLVVLKYGGRFGAVLFLAYALLGFVPKRYLDWLGYDLQTALGTLSLALVVLSVVWRGGRITDMLATIGAATAIATPGPNASPDPAIDREIQKQLDDQSTGTS